MQREILSYNQDKEETGSAIPGSVMFMDCDKCGVRSYETAISKSEKNPGREYYKCMNRECLNDQGYYGKFLGWCDEAKKRSEASGVKRKRPAGFEDVQNKRQAGDIAGIVTKAVTAVLEREISDITGSLVEMTKTMRALSEKLDVVADTCSNENAI